MELLSNIYIYIVYIEVNLHEYRFSVYFYMSHDFSHRKEETLVSSIHHNCQYCTHPAKNIVIAHNDLTQKNKCF